jgi:hypothetical protein
VAFAAFLLQLLRRPLLTSGNGATAMAAPLARSIDRWVGLTFAF